MSPGTTGTGGLAGPGGGTPACGASGPTTPAAGTTGPAAGTGLTPDGRHPTLVPEDWDRHVDPGEWGLGPGGLPFRRAARVLVLTADGLALLMTGHDVADPAHSWVFTPGGGIQPGETDRQAAARELAEESGIVVDPADLEGPVARRDAVFRFATVTCRQDEVFFLLRLRGPLALERAGWTQLERDAVDSISWWTPAELDAARRTGWEIYPSAVPGLVGSLRAGWDGRPLDLTEPPDAELLAQVAAGGTRSGGGRATS